MITIWRTNFGLFGYGLAWLFWEATISITATGAFRKDSTMANTADMQLLLADLILVTHTLFVAFVVLGLVVVLLGKYRRWRWVRNWRFRLAHLAAIGVVIAES
jgi:hypothetical protein